MRYGVAYGGWIGDDRSVAGRRRSTRDRSCLVVVEWNAAVRFVCGAHDRGEQVTLRSYRCCDAADRVVVAALPERIEDVA